MRGKQFYAGGDRTITIRRLNVINHLRWQLGLRTITSDHSMTRRFRFQLVGVTSLDRNHRQVIDSLSSFACVFGYTWLYSELRKYCNFRRKSFSTRVARKRLTSNSKLRHDVQFVQRSTLRDSPRSIVQIHTCFTCLQIRSDANASEKFLSFFFLFFCLFSFITNSSLVQRTIACSWLSLFYRSKDVRCNR